jgi:hypothetical protein
MIDYILKPNTLSHGGVPASGYHAQTVQGENRTTADFIRTMVNLRGGVTEGEAAMWLDLVIRAFFFEVSQGRDVNLQGFLSACVNIKGSFPNADSTFDPGVNSCILNEAAGGFPPHIYKGELL